MSYYKRTLNGGLRATGIDAHSLIGMDKRSLGFSAADAARLAELRGVFSAKQLARSFSKATMGSLDQWVDYQE